MGNLSFFSNQLRKFSNKRYIIPILIILLIILGVMQVFTFELKRSNEGSKSLDMRYSGYSQIQVNDMIVRIGSEGRNLYRRILIIDFGFIVVYSVLQSLLLTRLMDKANLYPDLKILNLLPYLRGGLDIVENSLLLTIINVFPKVNLSMISFSSTVTVLKWSIHLVILISLFSLGVVISSKSFSLKKSPTKASKTL